MSNIDTKKYTNMDAVAQLFEDLDNTNNQQSIDESKRKLAEVFNLTKDSWVVHGFLDYYCHTMSERVLDVLTKAGAPHDKYIFDRLFDLMREKDSRGVSNNKQIALNIFGYLVRANPTWLYKVTSHSLLKEILKLLKNDNDVVVYISALSSIIALLPIVPSSVAQYLPDLFDVFGHLAAWKDSQGLNEVEHLNLQIGLIFLFTRLYGMYPCNFMDYIKNNYIVNKDKQSIFQHTIKGLLDTVKVHPLLVTASKETEISPARWKKMEPHDVVFECARLSLEYNERPQDYVNECTTRHLTPINVPFLVSASQVKMSEMMLPNKTLALIQNDNKFDSIWSPSNVVHATPPPTGALSSHTSTPTPNLHNYGIQQQQQLLDGSSPPEAAVEATPETTPMKDNVKSVHSLPTNSTIARAIWNTSQPSSPLKKDSSPFRFSSSEQQETSSATTQRLLKMMDDRSLASQMHLKQKSTMPMTTVVSPPTVGNDEDKEDLEVRVINSRPMDVPTKLIADDNLPNFENEGSPCSVGGLHIPYSRSVYELKNKVNRLRLVSNCLEDASFSAGTSPDAHGNITVTRGNKQTRIRRFNSCPRMSFTSVDSTPIYEVRRDPRSTNIKKSEKPTQSKKFYQELRDDLLTKSNLAFGRIDASVQTVKTVFDQPYDALMTGIFNEEIKSRNLLRSAQEKTKASVKTPYELLDKVIEIAGTRNSVGGTIKTIDEYKESLQLMHLQLQYEKHRREVHADRNRRLLGMSRKIHQYEQNHDTLTEQVRMLTQDLEKVNDQLNNLRYTFNSREHTMLKETEVWRNKYIMENEENQKLRIVVEQLKTEVQEYTKEKSETHIELEKARGELFDVKNELRQMMIQAELASRYKEELNHLQSEIIMMGEVQLKCKEKFSSIELLEAKDYKIALLQDSYMEEINNLKATLESKISSLEAAKIKVTDLESQLTRRDVISADLKRDLKRTKEEYQEKINALEKKYTALKAIMLRKDEHILELYKIRSPVNMSALSPDSERGVSDIAGSLEHASSPLSLSQTSSDGLSASFSKSVTEIRNLQALVQMTSSGERGSDLNLPEVGPSKTNPADIPTTSSSRSSSNN